MELLRPSVTRTPAHDQAALRARGLAADDIEALAAGLVDLAKVRADP